MMRAARASAVPPSWSPVVAPTSRIAAGRDSPLLHLERDSAISGAIFSSFPSAIEVPVGATTGLYCVT